MTTTFRTVVDTQLASLDDTDCYATAWQRALQTANDEHGRVQWGGRGRGGRGLARRTFQPKDIVVEDVRLEYVGSSLSNSRVLLENATLKLLSGRVYALIGKNASGKSTLLRRIDAGRIPGLPTHVSTLYVPQEVSILLDSNNGDMCAEDLTPIQFLMQQQHVHSKKSERVTQEEIEHLEAQMDELDLSLEADQVRMEELANNISKLEDEKNGSNADRIEKEVKEALCFVGLSEESRALSSLSPGLRKKVLLAVPLVCKSDLILLDEPTNALDIDGLLMLRQLIDFLSLTQKPTILMVSHDRDLIDDVATDVIDFFERKLIYYPGGYSDYRIYRQQADLHQLRQVVALDKKRDAMIKTLDNLKRQPTPRRGGAKKKSKQIESFKKKIERQGLEKDDQGHKRRNQTAGTGIKPGSINAMDASSRKNLTTNQLLKMTKESVSPPPDKSIQFVFRDVTSQWGEPLVMGYDVGHSYHIPADGHLNRQAKTEASEDDAPLITKKDGFLFDCIDICIEEGETYCVVGETSSGKSTLLKILGKFLQPIEGTVKHALNLDVAYLDQVQIDSLVESAAADEHSISYLMRLFPKKTEQAIRGELTAFGLSPQQATTNIHFLSGGERCRLCLACMMLRDPQLLLLDEPTSNLDVESVEALVYGLSHWNGTTIMVCHDTNFVRSLNARCYALIAKEGKLRRVDGGIDEYLQAFLHKAE